MGSGRAYRGEYPPVVRYLRDSEGIGRIAGVARFRRLRMFRMMTHRHQLRQVPEGLPLLRRRNRHVLAVKQERVPTLVIKRLIILTIERMDLGTLGCGNINLALF